MDVIEVSPVVDERAAARYLGLSPATLKNSRLNGARANHVPPIRWISLGRRVLYRLDDLRAYLDLHVVDAGEVVR